MNRLSIQPRQDWETRIKEQGFVYYNDYYNETSCYEFSEREINDIEKATAEIFDMCCQVVDYVMEKNLWKEFFIPQEFEDLIRWSWKEDMMSFYGRMDLAYDGVNIKLLEFNADTPTGLLESSVVQWYWLQEYHKSYDQFNSIHEKLVAHIQECKAHFNGNQGLFFTCVDNNDEDFMTVKYLQDCAHQAGVKTDFIYIEDLDVTKEGLFCNKEGDLIQNVFKLYPYEWMFQEDFGRYLAPNKASCYWIEPAYKAILSNKMLLKYLPQLFPTSPYFLSCEFGKPVTESFVKKPVFSREGANITIVEKGKLLEYSDGDYGAEGYMFQEYFPLPQLDGHVPIIGSWLIGGVPAGIGIRESQNLITNNKSRFVPHYFK